MLFNFFFNLQKLISEKNKKIFYFNFEFVFIIFGKYFLFNLEN